MSRLPPIVIHEDEHLLIVNKPTGWNTHSPSPYAGEGIYEWLKNREPRWAKLAIIHRLDKETSGLVVFTKTPEANRSLTEQFTRGYVKKEYVLRSNHSPKQNKFVVKSHLKRIGEKYASIKGGSSGLDAETEFEVTDAGLILARPRTGRTHQIRVHASENGFPILGDTLYGGAPFERLCLHAKIIEFRDLDNKPVVFERPIDFQIPGWKLRRDFIDRIDTTAFRWINGAADGFPDWHLDQLNPFLLSQSPHELLPTQLDFLKSNFPDRGVYHKITNRHVRGSSPQEASPRHILGSPSSGPFTILENGVTYEMNFAEGYSTGLFLDQRDNRRRVFQATIPNTAVLNTFAYTCGFSVCAALAGARVTSLDLSKKYLDWGRRNFQLNNLNPDDHDFIYGDVFDWLKRLAKKGRRFDTILLDPPTFSQAKPSGIFRAEKDYEKLVTLALELLNLGGTLFASSNAARWEPEQFLAQIHQALAAADREILSEQYFPQPPDFPISRDEPAYLKTVWMQIA